MEVKVGPIQFRDTDYLKKVQYKDPENLETRVGLHVRFSTNPRGWHRWVFEQMDLPEEARILEVGCGAGHLWAENLSRLPGSWSPTLSDLSAGMVAAARAALSRGGAFGYLVQAVDGLAFPDGRFDAVLANHMLYHAPDQERALGEIVRVLKPGGRLYATTNGRAHLQELWGFVAQAAPEAQGSRPEAAWLEAIAGFSLETGGDLLRRWLTDLRLVRYQDALSVTQVAPLVAFVASSSLMPVGPQALVRLEEILAAELKAKGAIHIRKDSGLFMARKAR
jgi:SAM-dependent methyltransferase